METETKTSVNRLIVNQLAKTETMKKVLTGDANTARWL